jgi:glycosyltransferase involved in cell wall biosynthesis
MSAKLSICITTYNRGNVICETLNSIVMQLTSDVEIVVVNGASPDNTHEIMEDYQQRHPGKIRYFREEKNSGFDADLDKAVDYASGEYCWLMSDDDILKPDAIKRVLSELDGRNDLLVVNFEIRTADMTKVISPGGFFKFTTDRHYNAENNHDMFSETMNQLTYLGSVVIKRDVWQSRERKNYYGTMFVHVGVIFQSPPITHAKAIVKPVIVIRCSDHLWWPRFFEIWMFKWPRLVWSFPDFPETVKNKVRPLNPWRNPITLFWCRALGAYSTAEFSKYWPDNITWPLGVMARCISLFPGKLANVILLSYYLVLRKDRAVTTHNLLTCRHANVVSRFVARVFKYHLKQPQ